MSHEVEQMFSVKETPWHRLGRIVAEAPNALEAINLAGLNWRVDKVPAYAHQATDAGVTHIKTDKFALVRDTDQSIYGVVGKDYRPLQNSDAFNFFNPFVDSGECTYETAGSLKGGQRVWILAKLNRRPIEVTKGDMVHKFLLLSNGHDGRTSVRVGFSPIRVVCANTLRMAERGDSHLIRVSHFGRMSEALDEIKDTINAADATFEATAEQYRELARHKVSKQDLAEFVKIVWFSNKEKTERLESRIQEMDRTITRLFETGRGNDMAGTRGTYWALYNAATEYLSYEAGKTDDSRLNSLWFGSNGDVSQKAFATAMKMAVGQ